ncbi:YmfQ family protein [Thiohalomonas denitrificans]|uniref:YmfQ family protein n=1 Tax=Thiohalomonas denitrificans TaxID=415747 RepID=UPI0026EF4C88|nr:putative phage tail protein [Thiohalomonas denitrificans]
MGASDYLNQLRALLPRGVLWRGLRAPDTTFSALLDALAAEFARVDATAEALINEADPRTTLQLLAEWEAFAGLPDTCSGLGTTIDERRAALVDILTSVGGQSRNYFIGVAGSLGFDDSAIAEYDPHTVDETVDAPIYGADWQFAWKLTAPMPPVQQFNADSTVDESLGEVAPTTRLECAVNRRKPAHTIALFEYT